MATKNKPLEVSASDLKNSWHEFLERVSQGRQEVVVTRYGHPIAKLSPYEGPAEVGGIFGCLAGSVTIHSDIVAPLDEAWDADA
ncbi:MAG: type II toxin-antitoxin system prevent-host-death family antitoxin [Gemmatimonadales bacterium]|nr:MAG: type II toxin-antitoxin system prevent-host-death family antitoxin [Gemmatimonadales bacterium]